MSAEYDYAMRSSMTRMEQRNNDLQSRLTAAETRVKEFEQTLKSAGHFTAHHHACEIVRKSDFQNTSCTCGLDNLRAQLDKLKSK